MSPPVTMRTVAAAVGVATSTVSKALRDDRTISPARRAEIRRTAKKMGYRPNPLVRNLMAQLHGRRRRNDPFHIAWIDLWPDERAASGLQILKPLLRGAERRAHELGYGIEIHRPTRDGIGPEQLHRILVSRGQHALIVPPVPEDAMHYCIDLEGMAGVTIGTSLRQPTINRVAPNLYQGGQLACAGLHQRGYRRIGMVLSTQIHERVGRSWVGALLAEQQHWPAAERVPPLLLERWDRRRCDAWFRRHRPDVVLLAEPDADNWAATAAGGPGVPRVWLLIEGHRRQIRGIDYRGAAIGAAAVEMVVGQIHRNERGGRRIPNTLLLPGTWTGFGPKGPGAGSRRAQESGRG